MPANEGWRPVVGYEGFYEVSNYGQIKRLARVSASGQRLKEKTLKPSTQRGYKVVSLTLDGKEKRHYVHRLVAKAWLGSEGVEDLEVRHGPNGKSDNSVQNLLWGTREENWEDYIVRDGHYNSIKNDCLRGHNLSGPNLILRSDGRRTCRACELTRDTVRLHPGLASFFDLISNFRYNQLMANADKKTPIEEVVRAIGLDLEVLHVR